jgi:dTDP-4-amino-4,6-dideoxygalactose transaminase
MKVDRQRVLDTLEHEEIECRPVWKPMHMQPLYEDCPNYGTSVDRRLFETGICLPSGSNMTDEERGRISRALQNAFNARGT